MKKPILIAVIVVCGIAVTILNIQTFGPGKKPARRVQASVQNGPALPPDLASLVQEAMAGEGLHSPAAAAGHEALPSLTRDPFQNTAKPVITSSGVIVNPQPGNTAGLVCSAIMTGANRPSALINGKFYNPGDELYGYTLAWIASTGVTLQNSEGAKKFLPLAIRGERSGALRVDMGPKLSAQNN